MKDEDILAEAAKMVLTDKVPEQPFIRGQVTGISQTQYGMGYATFSPSSSIQPPQIELEVTMKVVLNYHDDEKMHRILHSGMILIMEDRLG